MDDYLIRKQIKAYWSMMNKCLNYNFFFFSYTLPIENMKIITNDLDRLHTLFVLRFKDVCVGIFYENILGTSIIQPFLLFYSKIIWALRIQGKLSYDMT